MTTKEIKEAVEYFEKHGEIAFNLKNKNIVHKTYEPIWNFDKYDYYPVEEEKEPLYEWWYSNDSGEIYISGKLLTEKEAREGYTYKYGKTGRYFDPETQSIKEIAL